jgi:hypothetical protein
MARDYRSLAGIPVASGRNRSSTIEAIRSAGSGFIVMRMAVLLSFWLPGAQRDQSRPETAGTRPVAAARR